MAENDEYSPLVERLSSYLFCIGGLCGIGAGTVALVYARDKYLIDGWMMLLVGIAGILLFIQRRRHVAMKESHMKKKAGAASSVE
jgi:uncharacterized membrane protein YfcA